MKQDTTLNVSCRAVYVRGTFSSFVPSMSKQEEQHRFSITVHQTDLLNDVHNVLAVFTDRKLYFGIVLSKPLIY